MDCNSKLNTIFWLLWCFMIGLTINATPILGVLMWLGFCLLYYLILNFFTVLVTYPLYYWEDYSKLGNIVLEEASVIQAMEPDTLEKHTRQGERNE